MKKIFLSAVLATMSWAVFAQDTTYNNNNGHWGDSNMNRSNYDSSMNHMNNNMNGTMDRDTGNSQMYNSSNQMNGTTNQQAYNTTSTSTYNAYGIPDYVQMNAQTNYPGMNVTWEAPTADWYHGYYTDNNGHYTHVYYSTDPYYNNQYNPDRVVGYTVSLPVLQTYVPDEVINAATNQYRQNLYDITAVKGNNGSNLYQVRVTENGTLKTKWIDSAGTAATDIWRTDEQMNMDSNMQMNNSNSTGNNATMDSSNQSMMNNSQDQNVEKTKMKTKMSDGSEIKTKTKDGKTKTKVDD